MKANVSISALRETKWELTLAKTTSDLIAACDYSSMLEAERNKKSIS
jgi:hypothetical protein